MTAEPQDDRILVARLDLLASDEATAVLRPCCASTRWLDQVVTNRPYGSLTALAAECDAALDALEWADVLEALAAHPRIGQAPAGDDVEARWSQSEQSGASAADDAVAGGIRAGNVLYERRFGFGYLICATGLSAAKLLAALQDRLGNDPDVEHQVVRTELGKIIRLRLAKVLT
jgi:2-oxo-4-hydroxy-4-carboxy-5-ureidoimidazoline decarboxylase